MNAQQLRNSILQEAIEGRLVPQDPNDEPASVLLERIREEKKRLVKEGKLKKKDLEETPVSEDEKPFEIPESWEWVRLKDVVSFIGGYAYDSHSFISSSSYQVLRLGNIKNDTILLNVNPVFISQALAEDTKKFSCKECDILITMTGTRKKRDYFFSVLVNDAHKNLFVNQRVGCLRPYNTFLAKWLIKVLKTETVLQQVFRYETGTANQGNLGAENILKTLFPLPPLAEQKRIVAKIEELLPKVEEYGKAQEALNKLNEELPEKLKKSILQEAIEGRLVPQDPNDEPASVLLDKIRAEKKRLVKEGKLKKKDLEETPISEDEKPFKIPERWEWVRISSLTNILNGFAFKSVNYTNEGIRVIRITNVQDGKIVDDDPKFYPTSEMDNIQKYLLKEGDLLMSLTGNVGRVGIIDRSLIPAALNQRVACLRLYKQEILSYLYLYLQSDHFKSKCVASGKGMAQLNISTDWLGAHIIPLPPLAEQKRIVAKIEQLMKEIDKLKK